QQQRALPDARFTPEQCDRSRHETAAEHPIELRDSSREAVCRCIADRRDRPRRALRRGRLPRARALSKRAPRTTFGAPTEPFGRLVAALLTGEANKCSGHGETLAGR